jgi:HK97 family phage portal protein
VIRRILGLSEGRSISFQDVWGKGLDFFGGASTTSGEHVTRESALQITAVYGAVRILSDSISTLPLDSFVREGGARKPYRPRPTWLDDPNPDLSMAEVLGQVMVSVLLDGTAYLATARDNTGAVTAIQPLDPAGIQPENVDLGDRVVRAYRVGGEMFTTADIIQINGMMLPGALKGCSPIVHAAETMGVALAAQRYGASFFGNGAVPGALVEAPGMISEPGIKALKAAWNDIHRGAGNGNRLAVLTEGAKFTKITLAPNEAQFLETRQFQVQDIARIYGVPPHLLADSSNSTSWGSGLAQQNTAFAQLTLRPWAERIEAAFSKLLRSEGAAPGVFVKLNLEALQRGSFPEQVTALSEAIAAGIFTIDEARALFDRAPLPNGLGSAQPSPSPAAPKESEQ